jgi:hypothetical protein
MMQLAHECSYDEELRGSYQEAEIGEGEEQEED